MLNQRQVDVIGYTFTVLYLYLDIYKKFSIVIYS